jgi:succinate-semialdehyde dehydrogenase/glutarate-semialdehyde dehydrogenase
MGIVHSAGGGSPASDDKTIRSVSPTTGALVGEVPVLDRAEVQERVRRAAAAQREWAERPLPERVRAVLAFRDALVARAEDLTELLARETGKPRHEALLHEVGATADLITYYARIAPRVLAASEVPLRLFRHRRSYVHHVPRGVVAVIAPWNFPLVIPMSGVVPALVSGCAVVLKPSEATPMIALEAKRIWDGAGLAPDLFGVVTGYAPTAEALLDAGVGFVHFTGSVANGRKVAAACGERLIPCVLELGGKAPLIVCEDADLELAARAIVFGGFANSGQICISVERVYAHREVHDALVERVVELVSKLEQGDPTSSFVDVGGLTTARQAEVAQELVADALDKGAVLRAGGKRAPREGLFFLPTVLAGCDHRMRVMKEEIFGPVVPIMKVDGVEQAVQLANASHLGLNAYVFTRDRERGRRVAERIEAGSVLVNDVLSNYGTPEAPFGGVKHSGLGRTHGEQALLDMCQARHVSYDRISAGGLVPIGFPYTPARYRLWLKAIRALWSGGNVLDKIGSLL